jgi:hypothetical protein
MAKIFRRFEPSINFNPQDFKNFYTRIKESYTGKITEDLNHLQRLKREIFDLFKNLSLEMLKYPREYVNENDYFTEGDAWYTTRMGAGYNAIRDTIKSTYTGLLKEGIFSHIPRNVDYFIEVNNTIKLGEPGKYRKEERMVNLEIFSDGNIINEAADQWNNNVEAPCFVVVEHMDKSEYFKRTSLVAALRAKNFYKETEYFSSEPENFIHFCELKGYYLDTIGKRPSDYIISQHLYNNYACDEEEWKEIIRNAIGSDVTRSLHPDFLKEFFGYKWLSKDILKEIDPHPAGNLNKADGIFAAFYHPVRFLEWLDKKLLEDFSAQ